MTLADEFRLTDAGCGQHIQDRPCAKSLLQAQRGRGGFASVLKETAGALNAAVNQDERR